MPEVSVAPFKEEHGEAVLNLTVHAWTPVFEKTQNDVPRFVYDAFYPDGWQVRQQSDVRALLKAEPENIWVALLNGVVVGFVGLRFHPEDQMGEIHIIAVSPDHQRKGIGRRLMRFAEVQTQKAGMKIMMVETVGDAGHAPARRAYEAFGFEPWPVARYFKRL